jgi:hypothetical protein
MLQVRVFIDFGDGTRTDSAGGNPQTDKVGQQYLDNFADFCRMANAGGIWVVPTFELSTLAPPFHW